MPLVHAIYCCGISSRTHAPLQLRLVPADNVSLFQWKNVALGELVECSASLVPGYPLKEEGEGGGGAPLYALCGCWVCS